MQCFAMNCLRSTDSARTADRFGDIAAGCCAVFTPHRPTASATAATDQRGEIPSLNMSKNSRDPPVILRESQADAKESGAFRRKKPPPPRGRWRVMLAGGGCERVDRRKLRVEEDRSRRPTFYSLVSPFCSAPPTARITRTSPMRGEVMMARPLPPRFPYTNCRRIRRRFHDRYRHSRFRRVRRRGFG
jgi:hypothetical protein